MQTKKEERESMAEEDAHREVARLNASMIEKFASIVNQNEPAADLWPQFLEVNRNYRVERYKTMKSANLDHEKSGMFRDLYPTIPTQ